MESSASPAILMCAIAFFDSNRADCSIQSAFAFRYQKPSAKVSIQTNLLGKKDAEL